jgi:hypothetical protein
MFANGTQIKNRANYMQSPYYKPQQQSMFFICCYKLLKIMEILEKTILKKKILFTEEDLKLAIVNHINNTYPELIEEDDDFLGLRDGIAYFEYDPYKHVED